MVVQATPITVGDTEMIVLAMRDISGDKRRGVLERTFFHDVLNIVSGLRAVAELLSYGDDPEVEEEYRNDLFRMSVQIGDEIMAQRQLLAAEKGELTLEKDKRLTRGWAWRHSQMKRSVPGPAAVPTSCWRPAALATAPWAGKPQPRTPGSPTLHPEPGDLGPQQSC
jgi:hypothetical protein